MIENTRVVLLTVAVGLFFLAGCQSKPEKIMVSPENIQLTAPDASAQLTAHAVDKKGAEVQGVTITWSSSNPSVAKVDGNGKVTAVGSGSATVTAKADALSANVAVTVSLAKKIKLDKDKLTLSEDTPEATVSATIVDEKDQPWKGKGEVQWTSADENIAKVDNGKVTGVGPGTTTVTATFKDLKAEVSVESTVPEATQEAAGSSKKTSTKKTTKKSTKKSTKKTTKRVGGKKRVGGR